MVIFYATSSNVKRSHVSNDCITHLFNTKIILQKRFKAYIQIICFAFSRKPIRAEKINEIVQAKTQKPKDKVESFKFLQNSIKFSQLFTFVTWWLYIYGTIYRKLTSHFHFGFFFSWCRIIVIYNKPSKKSRFKANL